MQLLSTRTHLLLPLGCFEWFLTCPPLISIRGWTVEEDPRYPVFLDAMRSADIDLIDLYVDSAGFTDLGCWARSVLEADDPST